MDDILSSIRKIIQEDEKRTTGGPAPAGVASMEVSQPATMAVAGASSTGSLVRAAGSDRHDDDVLLLTELLDDEPEADPALPPPAVAAPASPSADPPPEIAKVDLPDPIIRDTPPPMPPPSNPQPAPEPDAQPSIEIVQMSSNPISSAMDRLARAVEDAKPPIAAAEPGPTVPSGRTLEDMVKEMLRPMLQDWIDKNLPTLVERIVEREVQRLTRG